MHEQIHCHTTLMQYPTQIWMCGVVVENYLHGCILAFESGPNGVKCLVLCRNCPFWLCLGNQMHACIQNFWFSAMAIMGKLVCSQSMFAIK